jgi:membrane-associated phospholipid phosphatase
MGLRRSKVMYVLLAIAIILTILLVMFVQTGEQLGFDVHLTAFFSQLFGGDFFHSIFIGLNWLGNTMGVGVVAILFIVWLGLIKRDFVGIALIVFAVAVGNEVNKLLKKTIGRERPDAEHLVEVNSLSFPSGHAMISMILYFMIAYLVISFLQKRSKRWLAGILAGVMILLMGISRIVLGVHYPTDVAAGYTFGFIWVFFCIILYELLLGVLGERRKARNVIR